MASQRIRLASDHRQRRELAQSMLTVVSKIVVQRLMNVVVSKSLLIVVGSKSSLLVALMMVIGSALLTSWRNG